MRQIALLLAVTALAFGAFVARPSTPAFGAAYVVDRVDDTTVTACTGAVNDCTLRGAITDANGSPAADTITFSAAIASMTVSLGGALPSMTGGGDTIDGTGSGITVQGNENQTHSCLVISSSANSVRGLMFTDCNSAILLDNNNSDNNTIGPGNTFFDTNSAISVFVSDAGGNTIVGNKIGTNSQGTAIPVEGANTIGVLVNGPGNKVGAIGSGNRNVISGNVTGVSIAGNATGTLVYSNYIGTDVTGTVDLGNTTGVSVSGSLALGNIVGGTIPGQANVISGNNVNVNLAASSNTITGNVIGPDANGSGAAMVSSTGIQVSGIASANTIGPLNVISDNGTGVLIDGSSAQNNSVKGNRIGSNASGTSAVPNQTGVQLSSGARLNTIGGLAAGDGNAIAFNTGDGVVIDGASTTGNSVRANSIHSNGGLEINTSNGGNLELTPPHLLSSDGSSVVGFACAGCAVDIFSDASVDSRIYEGSATAASDGSFTFANEQPFVGPSLTATNTDGPKNTSELSAALTIDSDGDGDPDGTDPDDDNDSIVDEYDGCRVSEEDYDGFQDSDGCPEPDNDLDGVCDAGQASPSCTGSDTGRYTWVLPLPATQDCRNVPEDFDSFHDTDGCPEPDNDNDGHPDGNDDCPATDYTAGTDGVADTGDEPLNQLGVPIQTKEDYDNVLDSDGCHDSPGDDYDGDSFSDEVEALQLGTNPARACPLTVTAGDEEPDPWPVDFDDNQVVNVLDVFRLLPPSFGSGTGDPNYSARKDLVPNGVINVLDVFKLLPPTFGSSCAPGT